MNILRTTTLLVIAIWTAVLSADAEDASAYVQEVKDPAGFRLGEPVYSGPQPGEKLRGFSVIPPRRNNLGGQFDPVALALGKPHVLIFPDDSDTAEGIGAFAGAVETIAKNSQTGLAASAVILGHERTTGIGFTTLPDFYWDWFNKVYRIGYSPDGRDGPGAYGLDRNIVMTILIADAKGKVLYNFPFRETLQDRPDPHVVGALADAVGEDLETVASWFNEKLPDDSEMEMREMENEDKEQE